MVGSRGCLAGDPYRWPAAVRRTLALAVVALALAPGTAMPAGPDELAQTIEQHLTGIEFRIDIAPERAVRDLDEQKRRLRLLETQTPDHPMIPELTRRAEGLEDRLAEELGGDPAQAIGRPSGATPATGVTGPTEASGEVADRLQEVERGLAEAEAGFLQGQTDTAAEHLDRVDDAIAEIESDYADQVPAGHVPLMVAKERSATLRDQLGDGGSSGE